VTDRAGTAARTAGPAIVSIDTVDVTGQYGGEVMIYTTLVRIDLHEADHDRRGAQMYAIRRLIGRPEWLRPAGVIPTVDREGVATPGTETRTVRSVSSATITATAAFGAGAYIYDGAVALECVTTWDPQLP